MKRLRKKLILLITMLVTVLALNGCVRMEFNVTVKPNGKLDVSMLCAASDALGSFGDGSMFDDEEMQQLEKDGYTVSKYSEDGYVGYIASMNDIDPSKLASDDNCLSEFTSSEHLIKKGNTYILDFDLMDNEDLSESLEYLSMIENAGGYMRFNLTTPVKAMNHNASSVSEDGKTLTWNLLKMNGEPIHAEFKLPNKMMYIAAAITAVLVLIGMAAAIMKKKKPDKTETLNEILNL